MMNLSRVGFITLLVAALFSTKCLAAPDADSPSVVVQALYRNAQAHFGFTPETVKLAKPWVAPELYARLWKKVNEPTPKGDAPDIEGDVFLDSQDQPTNFTVGAASITGSKAMVEVNLNWDAEKRHYTVSLEQVSGAWKVTDIHYGKDGNLTDLL